MKPFHILVSANLVLILFLSACGGTAPEENPNPEPSTSTPALPTTQATSPTEPPEMDPTPVNNDFAPRDLTEKVKTDLAKQLAINTDQIRVAEIRAVDWPDASLGCPQPEMAYAQVITPGYYIALESQGQLYPYHTDQGDQIVLCLQYPSTSESETPLPVIPIDPDEIDDGQPWMPN